MSPTDHSSSSRDAIAGGRATLGVELGSTRIKACLIGDDPAEVIASGSFEWENDYVDGIWTYSLDAVWSGLQSAYANLVADVRTRYDVGVESLRAIGISAMMHGYLAFDAQERLLVPFRTWRTTTTAAAAAELSEAFGVNIPLRWSVAHLRQAVLDGEEHVEKIASLTTLAGYVHWKLTGRRVLGVGDASGMFPIDPATGDWDAELLERYRALERPAGSPASASAHLGEVGDVHDSGEVRDVRELLPEVLLAGADAGALSVEGAALLDPTGALSSGAILCPPEGDAGTGMVATNAIAPRTGNVSAGTSIFAMVVLEHPLANAHEELDIVTTPTGDPVAMVHCNNGASELAAWVRLFDRFADASGGRLDSDEVYRVLFDEALAGDPDAGGLLAFNHLAGEPIAGLAEGRPLFVRTPDSRFTLANVMRAQLYGVFATLAIGMRVLADEGAALDQMNAHGGMFRTPGVAQRMLAGALAAPVSVAASAGEGGAWGIAVLAAFAADQVGTTARETSPGADGRSGAEARSASLADYLDKRVFAGSSTSSVEPRADDVAGFEAYLERYRAGLAVERAAVEALSVR